MLCENFSKKKNKNSICSGLPIIAILPKNAIWPLGIKVTEPIVLPSKNLPSSGMKSHNFI